MSKWSRSGLTVLFKYRMETYHRNEPTCNSSGNTQPQLPQLTEPLWTDPGLKSGIDVRKPISHFKKKKKSSRQVMNHRIFCQSPCKQEKNCHQFCLTGAVYFSTTCLLLLQGTEATDDHLPGCSAGEGPVSNVAVWPVLRAGGVRHFQSGHWRLLPIHASVHESLCWQDRHVSFYCYRC